MSNEKRLRLLDPVLGSLDGAWPNGDPIIVANDIATVRQAFKVWFTITSDILYLEGYSAQSVTHRLATLSRAVVQSATPSSWLVTSKLAYDLLIEFVSMERHIHTNLFVDFKDQLIVTCGNDDLVCALVAPISRLMSPISEMAVKRNGCWSSSVTRVISRLAQYFGFLMKLELNRADLESSALVDYVHFEQNYFNFDDKCNHYSNALRSIILDWFSGYTYNGDRCRHGVGSTANTKRSKFDKYKSIKLDTRLEYLYKRLAPNSIHDFFPFPLSDDNLERCSKLKFVPKNISKLRSISMEPPSLQFVQQGVMLSLYDYIAKHKVMGKHIKLQDQNQNKSYAYDGSITDRYSTIDLSAASDSVSYKLAKYLFSGNTELWRWLVGTRSDHTLLPDGTKLFLNKFASMGSAVCFPIETIIFAAIAELSVRLGHEQGLTRDNETGIYNDYYTIFGDDIIVPKGVYNLTVDILNTFGFSINRLKSFDSSPFKESCGGNYFCGYDITPIKWSIACYDDNKVDVTNYAAICGIVNAMYTRENKVTRCYLIQLILRQGYKPVFSDRIDQAPMIYSPTPTNFHCRARYNMALQRVELDYTVLKTSPQKPISDNDVNDMDAILYLEWLRKVDKVTHQPNVGSIVYLNKYTHQLSFEYCLPLTYKTLVQTKVVKGKGRYVVI